MHFFIEVAQDNSFRGIPIFMQADLETTGLQITFGNQNRIKPEFNCSVLIVFTSFVLSGILVTSKMLSLQKVLVLVSLALLEVSLVTCQAEDDNLAVYGNEDEYKEPDDAQMQNMLEAMYRNYPLDQFEENYGK